MKVTSLYEILLQVSDVERSLKFYRDGLGIPFADSGYGDDSYLAVVGSVKILLHPRWNESLQRGQFGPGVILHLAVEDADAAYHELQSKGFAPKPPRDLPWGREFSVEDPDGYEIDVLRPAG